MLIVGKTKLECDLRNAKSYDEWLAAARAYDEYRGLDRWRRADHSSQYDYVSIRSRLDQLRKYQSQHDIRGLYYTLNEGIHGNMGGMGKAGLYGYAKSGTKYLIMEYIDEVVHSLELIAADTSGDIDPAEKLDFFRRASHCFGRTAFMMSGSGSLLYFHIGVVRTLAEHHLLPSVLSGSSGGSVVGAIVGTHNDKELQKILSNDHLLAAAGKPGRAFSISPQEVVIEQISQFVPDLTFQQAFQRTGRAVNVSIAPAEMHQTSRLLNSTTSPGVLIRSGVLASCSVPGFYAPVTLEALDSQGNKKKYLPSRRWVDGSVSDDLPAKRLARLYGVNHYIVSQTNPHVLPFVTDGHRKLTTRGVLRNAARRSAREWFNAMTTIADRAEGRWLSRNNAVARLNSLMRSVINQDYVGDINILPDYKVVDPTRLLTTPTERQIVKLLASGERCTWPKLEMIRLQTKIGRKLESILEQNRQDLVSGATARLATNVANGRSKKAKSPRRRKAS